MSARSCAQNSPSKPPSGVTLTVWARTGKASAAPMAPRIAIGVERFMGFLLWVLAKRSTASADILLRGDHHAANAARVDRTLHPPGPLRITDEGAHVRGSRIAPRRHGDPMRNRGEAALDEAQARIGARG